VGNKGCWFQSGSTDRSAAQAFFRLSAEIEAEFAAILGQAEMARLRGLLEELGRRLHEGQHAEPKSG
jgi:hypothetical protein